MLVYFIPLLSETPDVNFPISIFSCPAAVEKKFIRTGLNLIQSNPFLAVWQHWQIWCILVPGLI